MPPAVEPIRRKWYELFYYPHLFGLAAIALAMVHSYVCVGWEGCGCECGGVWKLSSSGGEGSFF